MQEAVKSEREAGPELDTEIGVLLGRTEQRFYSTEAEPAIAVLYFLHAKGYFWRLDSVPNGIICTLQKLLEDPTKVKDPKRQTFQVGAKTLPLAVCIAALKTNGNKKD